MPVLIYYFILILEASFAIFLSLYLGFLIYSSLMGAPYVPTKRKLIRSILKSSGLRKGHKFLDLGCGDGRIVLIASKEFGADSYGVDINPLIVLRGKLTAKLKRIRASFFVKNIFEFPISDFDVIYIFLFPEMVSKLSGKIEKEAKKGVVIISHGFKINHLNRYLVKTLQSKSFSTYFYKIS